MARRPALNLTCQYDREIKKRGRRSNASKQNLRPLRSVTARGSSEPNDNEDSDTTRPSRSTSVNAMGGSQLRRGLVASQEGDQYDRLQLSPSTLRSPHDERAGLAVVAEPHQTLHSARTDSSSSIAFPFSPRVTASQGILLQYPSCRYPCLETILPGLKGFMSPNEACNLLDIFFTEPGNSLSSSHCPYALTTILRKSSLLHQSRPRSTSPALLATILWCVAQTADRRIYYVPGARERITSHLYSLAMSYLRLRDMDNWHRVAGGWQLEDDCTVNVDGCQSDQARRTFSAGPQPTVDDVLTFTLLAIVISGGVFKADCLKWWNKAVCLVKYLGYHTESGLMDNTGVSNQPLAAIEVHEERRRAFWLVYVLDRHLALSFNRPLDILDAECQVLSPLPEDIWQNLDMISPDAIPRPVYGPPTTISGPGLFEYFLPLMAILGDIIDLRLRRHHPRLPVDDGSSCLDTIRQALAHCETSLGEFAAAAMSPTDPPPGTLTKTQAQLVVAYGAYIIKVLYVLLHGEWDAVSMLEDHGNWIASPSFSECASNSIAAAQSITDILSVDPELSFMPYLFGIYLFHGSFVLLLFAERMPQIGPNESVEQACEVIIRAHEVSIVTLSTDFQKTFRKAFRSILYSVRRPDSVDPEFPVLRKEVLSMYRWTMGYRGLCL
ncbi:hypothetical protein EYZ11_010587 [Aspergillus tanneri]|uniref:Xylanolytic transcriptional activator regulatory domain-containing protein n=1 Tax=Aspergillus tanneri TaxID=1220188 RepID=A0A4S3JAC5_9EURO|nr:hypothetical protein EYZ11_010587 [Aspergillus tanneri]